MHPPIFIFKLNFYLQKSMPFSISKHSMLKCGYLNPSITIILYDMTADSHMLKSLETLTLWPNK